MDRQYSVYIMTNKPHGVLYVGVTKHLERRCYEHKQGLIAGFSKKYNLHSLVYYETTTDALSALNREKRLKHWKRDWKVALIEEENPDWRDLSEEMFYS